MFEFQGSGVRGQGFGFGVKGFRAMGLRYWFRASDSIKDLTFRAKDLQLRVQGVEYKACGVGCRV